MEIAEFAQVRALYPTVPQRAVEHLLWALHRVRPSIEAGLIAAATAALRGDLAVYPGEVSDLASLGVPALFDGLERGRLAFADALGAAGLLAPGPGAAKRYVVAGPLLDVRLWARQRGIAVHTVIAVCRATDTYKLRGLDGTGLAVVRLGDRRADPAVEDALTALLEHGAVTLPARWMPGRRAEPGEPQLDLRRSPAAASPAAARPATA